LKKLNIKNNVEMKAYKSKTNDVIDLLKGLQLPVIVQWNSDHFVVVEKVGSSKVKIIDPAIGRVTVSFENFKEKFSGFIILLAPTPQFDVKKTSSEMLFGLKTSFVNKNAVVYIIAIVIAQIVALLFSVLIRDILDKRYSLQIFIGLIILLISLQIIVFLIKQLAQEKANILYENQISNTIFKGIFSRPILYFRNNTVGAIIEKINLKTGIRDNILLQILPALLNFFSVFLLAIYLGTVSILLTLFLIGMACFYLLISSLLFMKKNQANIEYMQKSIDFTSTAQEDLNQIDQLKAQALEEVTSKNWIDKNLRTLKVYNSILRLEGITNTFSQTFNYISMILVIMIGIYFTEKNVITIADLILFQSGVSLFTTAVAQVQVAVFETSKLKIYSDKISDLLVQVPPKEDMVDHNSPYSISIKKMNYSYDQSTKVFEDVNFSILKGEKVAIVGQSGSGKSTLLNILLGLYSYEGKIIYGYKNFRKKVGVVLQSMSLRQGTVLENLMDTSKAVETEKILQVLSDVNILDLVDALPKKIFSQMFQNGKNVSGGQMQRLLIAKSLLNDTKLVFWDEAFSSLDNRNRFNIYKNVLNNSRYKEKTIILISHHLDVLPYVDKVIFVHDKNVEFASHQDLLNNSSEYQKFLESSEMI
jgi:ABC-type bacteriocin/lantibiotic exporter with double-glycine peptidase domain